MHVHEPFAPSTGSAALRHSQSLNVATFHEPVERVLSTQVARMLVEVFFGRIDERLASNEATGELLQRFFPGQYQLVRPGADVAEPALEPRPPGRVRIVHCAEEERGALRLLLRALRKLPEDLDWEGVIWFDGPTDPSPASASGYGSVCGWYARGTASRRSSWPGRTSLCSPPEGCAQPLASSGRRSPPAPCRSSPISSSTASWSGRASAGCSSRSGTCSR